MIDYPYHPRPSRRQQHGILVRCFATLFISSLSSAFTPGEGDGFFSLAAYQRSRARETSKCLDASRFHFQILLVDNNNFHGRIAESILSRIVEYNDARCILFPSSSTIVTHAPLDVSLDASAPQDAMDVCNSLGLDECSELGTLFNLSTSLDEYDLIIALDDDIQSLILRSLPVDRSGYEQKCRLLSEFLSVDFCNVNDNINNDESKKLHEEKIINMLEPELWERVEPFYNELMSSYKDKSSGSIDSGYVISTQSKDIHEPRMILSKSGAAVPNTEGWPIVEAAMIMACAGITRFCLDTMDRQFDESFQNLLDLHFNKLSDLEYTLEEADAQLRKGSFSVTGYFSPKERKKRIQKHMDQLKLLLLGK